MYAYRGNALFLILIGVALFAALSYAVTQTGRGGRDARNETIEIEASRLFTQMASIRSAVDRLTLLGCPKEQLSYEGAPGSYANQVKFPSDTDCLVFNGEGGGQAYQSPDVSLLNAAFSGAAGYGTMYFVRNISPSGACPTGYCNLVIVPFVSDEVCLVVNRKLHGHDAIPLSTDIMSVITFRGSFTPGAFFRCLTNPIDGVHACGRDSGCFTVTTYALGSNNYSNVNVVYMQVMNNPP